MLVPHYGCSCGLLYSLLYGRGGTELVAHRAAMNAEGDGWPVAGLAPLVAVRSYRMGGSESNQCRVQAAFVHVSKT